MLIMFEAQSFNGFLDFVVRLGFPGEQCPWSMQWGHRARGFLAADDWIMELLITEQGI